MADPSGAGPDELACIDLVNRVTEYLDGELDESERAVIHLVGRLTPTDVARIDALTRVRLMATLSAARRR